MTAITSNRTLLEKADLSLADLLNGGELQPAQAKKFIRLLIEESVILGLGTVKTMKAQTQLLEKAVFGQRILRAGAEATALPIGERSKLDTTKTTLAAKLFKAEVHLNNEVLEDQLEQGGLRQTVMELMAERISTDMDEVLVQGDTASGDTFLAQFDGMLKAATTNVVAGGGTSLDSTKLKNAIKAMPTAYIRNKKKLRYLTSVDAETDYRDLLTARDTVVGDRMLEEDAPIMYSGIPLIDVPMFPENLGGGNETNVILTDPKNICCGIWRKVVMETDKDISAGVLKIVASVRFDFKYVEETAVVKVDAVTVS
jgi:hypothetical protein